MDATIEDRITRYTPSCLSPAQWALAGPVVRAAVLTARPASAEHAQSLLSKTCLFLAHTPLWDKTSVPNLAELITEQAIAVEVAYLSRDGRSNKTAIARRTALRRVARTQAGGPSTLTHPGARPRQRRRDPSLSVLLACDASLAATAPAFTLTTRLPLSSTRLNGFVPDSRPPSVPGDYRALAAPRDHAPRPGGTEPVMSDTHPDRGPARDAAAPRRTSRAAALRHAKQLAAERQRLQSGPVLAPAPDPALLPEPVRAAIAGYRPRKLPAARWAPVSECFTRLIIGYQPTSRGAVTNAARPIVDFLLWFADHAPRPDRSAPLTPGELLRPGLVEAWTASLTTPDATRATQRTIARRAVASLTDTGNADTIGHQPVAAPYNPAECARFRALADNQPTAARRKDLSFTVGLGAGAGLDGRDLRHVRRKHIRELTLPGGDTVLVVELTDGPRPRTTVVRRDYAQLVRTACRLHDERHADPRRFVLGRAATRHNITTPSIEHAVTARDGEKINININRLRSTWLLALMCAPIPLGVLLHAAGLRSARSLTDLLPYCPPPPAATSLALIAAAGLEPPAVAQ